MQYFKTKVISNRHIIDNVFLMKVEADTKEVKAGQFYMLKLKDSEPILPRPISVCDVDDEGVEFCYIVVGKGTEKLSALKTDDEIYLTGSLGNGFDVEEINKYKNVALVSGGIGIAPFVMLSRQLNTKVHVYAGFSNTPYLMDRVSGDAFFVTTESGVQGKQGYITDVLDVSKHDLVIGCGPEPFLKILAKMCKDKNVPSLISMDKHMACGVGACLACACKTIHGNKRCCVDGPIFKGEELVL